eukprot:scaffold2677_cov220-Pinguiococcus_pyrenoidosus.AAC.5
MMILGSCFLRGALLADPGEKLAERATEQAVDLLPDCFRRRELHNRKAGRIGRAGKHIAPIGNAAKDPHPLGPSGGDVTNVTNVTNATNVTNVTNGPLIDAVRHVKRSSAQA